MGAVWQQGKVWMRVLRSGRLGPDRCCQGRMLRYPDCLASGPGLKQQAGQRLRQRIDQSKAFQFICEDVWMSTLGLTKMMIPSASFCQCSALLLSSSSAALEYMSKISPELSPRLDSPCSGGFGVVELSPWRSSPKDS
jgi:hypothetical protein